MNTIVKLWLLLSFLNATTFTPKETKENLMVFLVAPTDTSELVTEFVNDSMSVFLWGLHKNKNLT